DEIKYIALFENITGAITKDVIIDDDRLIFVVKEGDIGRAIGKRGINIKRAKDMLHRNIDIVEFADSEVEFIKNTLAPARIKSVSISEKKDRKVAIVNVEPKDRGIAIGKNGKNVARARLLAKRYLNIDDVIIS
ncbi:MAG: NusA-like transcription termination signal-binding factor, partial [Candidatus Lokiarchaeota archaeon]|nr:NusA-like transcription termination signal-binding factor [Candidatus Lokiarchaeota archaeon]